MRPRAQTAASAIVTSAGASDSRHRGVALEAQAAEEDQLLEREHGEVGDGDRPRGPREPGHRGQHGDHRDRLETDAGRRDVGEQPHRGHRRERHQQPRHEPDDRLGPGQQLDRPAQQRLGAHPALRAGRIARRAGAGADASAAAVTPAAVRR